VQGGHWRRTGGLRGDRSVTQRAVPKEVERPDWRDASVGIRGVSGIGGATCTLVLEDVKRVWRRVC
jgi:hypothetical protein